MEREREDSNEDLRESVCMAKHSEGETAEAAPGTHTEKREQSTSSSRCPFLLCSGSIASLFGASDQLKQGRRGRNEESSIQLICV